MPNYRLELAYDGTAYNGWQKQGNTERTLQGLLERALTEELGEPIELAASGRTDAGVHALRQVCSFRTQRELDCEAAAAALRKRLPKDIGVLSLAPAAPRFHARLNCKEKTYVYHVWNSCRPNVFLRRYSTTVAEPLDLAAMQSAAALLTGEHDYLGYCTGKPKKSTIRRIGRIAVERDGDEILFTYTGNGFLYNMVRILTGTLLEVGLGRRSIADAALALTTLQRSDAGFTAPAQGLFLSEIKYE